MVTGRYDVTISRLMPIYNGNRARQGAHQGLFVRQVEERRKHLFQHTTFNQNFLKQEHPDIRSYVAPDYKTLVVVVLVIMMVVSVNFQQTE